MKASTIFFALMVSLVSAQVVPSCTVTSTLPATYTLTNTVVSTYCPLCDVAKLNDGVYTTVFATALVQVRPTGLDTSTYTVTNVCTGSTACPTIPSGYTTTAVVCTACPGSPTYTVTTPVTATGVKLTQYTGAAEAVSAQGMAALAAGMGSVFFGMLAL